ncbi:amidase [Phenylobacterium sp. J367]|uniref:amidase n=1 Tax=Phenylobacterium sp. J367 TaxID=2898435 RepID=UPI0021519911|nr:amidase [Phenylobacterium sp. J367]MCR5878882.1 amidase [Phenylobacterium sp. J367]
MLRIASFVGAVALAGTAAAQPLSPYASAAEQQAAMRAGAISAERLTQLSLDRIARIDRAGPKLNSVLTLNPHALADARRLDQERQAGRVRGPLHGVPILLKDNIESQDGTATTAGSLALVGNVPERDAPIVKRLTDAGAVILGKANLSEWANFRSTRSISGWSAAGGLVRNPYGLDRTACGSSSGSGAAVAAGLVALAIGTETDGSVTCPAAMTGIVGLKPTVGLVSRTHIVPISPAQDTAGPMTRTVADAAAVLTAIAGSDPLDPATAEADRRKTDYVAALDPQALRGARIGVLRNLAGRHPDVDAEYEKALTALRDAGAVLVEVKGPEEAVLNKVGAAEGDLLRWEFKAALDAYLATTPPAVRTRTLEALIAFNAAEPRELPLFGQEIFEQSAKTPPAADRAMAAKRAETTKLAADTLDKLMREANVEALVSPSGGPASIVDPVNGGRFFGSPSTLPAVSGYPHLTVPMGQVRGLPVGLSFLGPAWSEGRLLSLGHAFELETQARRPPGIPAFDRGPSRGRQGLRSVETRTCTRPLSAQSGKQASV